MNRHSLKTLEFDKITGLLVTETDTVVGAELASALTPFGDLESVSNAQIETNQARLILADEPAPFGGIKDIRQSVAKAVRDGLLQPRELLDIAYTLAAARRLRAFFLKRKVTAPKLAAIASDIVVLDSLEQLISKAIADNCEIKDTASTKLESIRNRLRTIHNRLTERLQSIIQSPSIRNALQDPIITTRSDRYCIPVKSEYRHQVPGIVHDTSASGATLFIEPASIVEMGNELKEQAVKEREEIESILRKLAEHIAKRASDIELDIAVIARLDFICAKAKLGCKMNGLSPTFNEIGFVRLMQARHPLLKGDVVPIDIEVGGRFRALLITGPNTGGKTVALKTVGLLALMAQSGLQIPVGKGSELPIFQSIFADIGDEQSIEQSLSTFSSHICNIIEMIAAVNNRSLILLDEIGAGTDPDEGAALAKAIIQYFISKNARIIATSHYGELKEYAFISDDIENACVEFDIETLKPTYKVLVGVPGSSNALLIAERLGLPKEIIESAQKMLIGAEDSSAKIIRKIEEKHKAAIDREKLAERASEDAETLKNLYEERLEKLENEYARRERELKKEAQELIEKQRKRLDKALSKLEKMRYRGGRAESLKKQIEETLADIEEKAEELADIEQDVDLETPYEPQKGDTVRVMTIDKEGVILELDRDNRAIVQVGAMRVEVPSASLRPYKSKAQKVYKKPLSDVSSMLVAAAESVSPELKLIGHRAESALESLEKYIDTAYGAGLAKVRIIHGKGTGVLRNVVWEYLKNHPGVQSYRLGEQEEGGSGATIVEFKH